jgi:hypothetical protein
MKVPLAVIIIGQWVTVLLLAPLAGLVIWPCCPLSHYPGEYPITGTAGCCARAASGHAAAAPPSSIVNARRFNASASRPSVRKNSTPQYGGACRAAGLGDTKKKPA